MPMSAHFEEQQKRDRRGAPRRSLKLGLGGGAGHNEPVTIHDLSLTGALLETSVPMLVGSTFEVELPRAGKIEAEVVWSGGEYYGCQFALPISPAVLSAALLQSSPEVAEPPASDPLVELRELNSEVERLALKMERAIERLTRK
jgi:hypothetical protein